MSERNKIKVKEQLNIRLVLDRSGSMGSCRETTVDSINKYIHEIKKESVEGVFTLSTFDNRSIDIPISRISIKLLEPSTNELEITGTTLSLSVILLLFWDVDASFPTKS